jgi:hypothetical protein
MPFSTALILAVSLLLPTDGGPAPEYVHADRVERRTGDRVLDEVAREGTSHYCFGLHVPSVRGTRRLS